ncbi:oxidoreductase [Devosia sp. Root436]|uniref:NAD(P)-dependent oxidoreductase n=1 Tax=Devosia sp. Root436 TaxID=1736537 RepID=UPI0006FB73C7|nr:NAD(P)-dependent oxidoreductase [Devosia sp. Root436]KQX38116.1 oxidoreductase [Devosia sp. Root436]
MSGSGQHPAVGFVGIGNMGFPMARRLLEAGYPVIAYDPNAAALQKLAGHGAEIASSPAEVANRAETVLLSLPTPQVVLAVALGEAGLAEGSKLRLVVDLSTVGPESEAALAEKLAAAGIATLDCPISGGVAGANKGTLALMVAGKKDDFDLLLPLLQVLGRPVYIGAKPGDAQMMKVINNLVSLTALAISSEALVLGRRAGLDPDVMIEVFNMGSARNSATVDKLPNFVLSRSFDFGFALGLSAKDTKLCLDAAQSLGVPMMIGSAVNQLLTLAKARNGAEADMTTIIKPLEEWADVEVAGAGSKR